MYNIHKYMSMNPTPKKIKTIATILFVFGAVSVLSAAEPTTNFTVNKGKVASSAKTPAKVDKNLTKMQMEARDYREQGVKLQQAGDLDAAMGLYQKAIVLDPTYAAAFNDAGVIYESRGLIDQAEESYLRCVTIDPNYIAAYTNLALLNENKRDIAKAAVYWDKRAKLGSPDDSWTKRAAQRLSDIRLVLSDKPFDEAREQDVIRLMSEVSNKKAALQKDNKALARSYLNKAKLYYKKGDNLTAYKTAIDASQLDPANKEIEEFVQKVQTRLLSK